MNKPISFLDITSRNVVVVFKHSRFSYAKEHGLPKEQQLLINQNDQIAKALIKAHEKNLQCIEAVTSILFDLGIKHHLLCRSDLKKSLLKDSFVITVGGDGTLLDASHYCIDAPILGVNSDPDSSIGALCAATKDNFRIFLEKIYNQTLGPRSLSRLSIDIDERHIEPLALNDILFCHKNPASMSRYRLSLNDTSQSHRSSGLWVATAAGSTGGIYSSGSKPLPMDHEQAIFRVREVYWTENSQPQLLHGFIAKNETLTITSEMIDAEIFIDGPHKNFALNLGESVKISIADDPLWLFDGPGLLHNRERIIEQRKSLQTLL